MKGPWQPLKSGALHFPILQKPPNLIKLQYDTGEMFVVILGCAISRPILSRMVPVRWSTEVCKFYIKDNSEVNRSLPYLRPQIRLNRDTVQKMSVPFTA